MKVRVQMKFKAFKIMKYGDKGLSNLEQIQAEQLRNRLNTFEKIEDHGAEYSPLYIQLEENYILGTLVQSYLKELYSYSDNGENEEIELGTNNLTDRVFFYIDVINSLIFIQNKRYPAPSLKMGKTIERITNILSDCFGINITLISAKINYSLDEINRLFLENQVTEITFSNLIGIEVPEGAEIHNPVREWDDTFSQSWNKYSKDEVDSFTLKAAKGHTLSKNPFARMGFILAKESGTKGTFKKMMVNVNGEKSEIKEEGNENKIIPFRSKQNDNSYDAYEQIKKHLIPGYNKK